MPSYSNPNCLVNEMLSNAKNQHALPSIIHEI